MYVLLVLICFLWFYCHTRRKIPGKFQLYMIPFFTFAAFSPWWAVSMGIACVVHVDRILCIPPPVKYIYSKPISRLSGFVHISWWRHQMETFSALLAICARNSPVTGEFPAQRPVTRSFDISFDLHLNKRLSKQSWGWWFETPSCPLWRHCNDGCEIGHQWACRCPENHSADYNAQL